MTEKEYDALCKALAPLINAEGMLNNLKKRVPMAMKELEGLIKKQTKEGLKDWPWHAKLHAEYKRQDKSAPAAYKAVGAVLKLGGDKKKMMALSVADAKKQLTSAGKFLTVAQDDAAKVAAVWKATPMHNKSLVNVVASIGYTDHLVDYLKEYTSQFAKWK